MESAIFTGPDPDIVEIGSTGGDITLAGTSAINDAVAITTPGTVGLQTELPKPDRGDPREGRRRRRGSQRRALEAR